MTIPPLDLAAMHAEVRSDLDRARTEVASTASFIGGPRVERFEEEWAAFCGCRHAVDVDAVCCATLEWAALGSGGPR